MIHFKPSNPEIEKIFNRLVNNSGTTVKNPKLLTTIGKHRTIKKLRAKDHIFFGYDRQKHQSIIFFPPNVKLKKNLKNNGFDVEIF